MYQGVGEIVQRLSSFLLLLSQQKPQLLLARGQCKSFGQGFRQLLEISHYILVQLEQVVRSERGVIKQGQQGIWQFVVGDPHRAGVRLKSTNPQSEVVSSQVGPRCPNLQWGRHAVWVWIPPLPPM